MDVFGIRNRLINDYASYIRSFIHLRDPIISEKVYESLTEGLLWPDPLIQLNPAFEPGEWIEELADGGVLHPECRKIFRIKPEKSDELKGMYYWHALLDGWENMTYEAFLKARRKAIAQIIREGYRRLSGGLDQ